MPAGAVLVCTVDVVDGICPEASQRWIPASAFDPFALPSTEHLTAAFNTAIVVFFIPTMIAMLVALGVRWLLEAIS
ncbi:hypothetical protein [Sphingomonas sp. CV7422]|uniref:hypothetical protein n=1 Tax=Sphingomonas sp. CV7422 TaxID=3018036 RepID=UPI0022FE47C6|nr:hypothetical protein [Sphingomonas sp. CV7422]